MSNKTTDFKEYKSKIAKLLNKFPEVVVKYTILEKNTCDCCECQKDDIVGKWFRTSTLRKTISSYKEFDKLTQQHGFEIDKHQPLQGHETTIMIVKQNEDGTYEGTYKGNGASQTILTNTYF